MRTTNFSKHFMALVGLLPCFSIPLSAHAQAGSQHVAFIQAEDYTWFSDSSPGNTGGQFRTDDVDIESTNDEGGGYNVGWIDQGEWLAFQGIQIPSSGNYTIKARVASPNGATMSLDLNGGSIPLATIDISSTGGWDQWETVKSSVHIDAGTYDFGVYANTAGWNLNWLEIIKEEQGPAPGDVVWAVNAGGTGYQSIDGTVYAADEGFSGGSTASTTQSIHATQDPSLYQSERWGQNFSYTKSLPNGTYSLSLKLAEIYWSGAGQRLFSVSAEGVTRLPSVDIAGEKGNRTHAAYDLSIPNIVVRDGELNIDFGAIVDAAKVSAFVVRAEHIAEPDWVLVWQDEFNIDGAVDASKWTHEEWNPGHVNNEWQRYTNRTENSRVENGVLVIEAHRDYYMGDEYSSARIHSAGKGDLLYGRIEVRAKLPNGLGTWPAIWMMPTDVYTYATRCDATTGWDEDCDAWPNSGEIDIMEHVGYDTGKVHATVHNLAGYWVNGEQKQATVYEPTVDDSFHVYAIEWSPDKIDMFIDGTLYYSYVNEYTGFEQWPYDHSFHVILNLVVGGDWGAVAGVDPNIWPQRMEVDYVRMFQR